MYSQTMRRTLKKGYYSERVARRQPFVNEANRKKKVNYAREFVLKEDTWRNDVIFSDESTFNIFSSDGRRIIWRKKNKEF